MSASISYAPLHPALSHLSIEQICEIHARYMTGATVQSLLAEYRIEYKHNQLAALLPLLTLNDQPCPSCCAPMQQKWPTKAYRLQSAFCKPCGHEQIKNCLCRYCCRHKLKSANREWADTRVPYSQLDLRHKILLSALLLTQQGEIAVTKGTRELGPFAPGYSSTKKLINELWDTGLIVLSRAPVWITSNHRSEWVYMPEEYGWSNNVSAEEGAEAAVPAPELVEWLFTDFDNNLQTSDEPVLVAMIKELAEEAAYTYIAFEMYKAELDLSCEAATRKVLRTMLETLSLADICAIGWQAAKNCGKCFTNNVAKCRRHAINMLPGQMTRIAEARLQKPDAWKVDMAINKVSRVERVLHEVLFGALDEYFSWPLDVYWLEVVVLRLKGGGMLIPG